MVAGLTRCLYFGFFFSALRVRPPPPNSHALSDWDAGAEAPPDPTLWEADWDDDGVDDAFGKALADTLAQAQQQAPPQQQQAPAPQQ